MRKRTVPAPPRPQLLVEALEPRILYSADAAVLLALSGAPAAPGGALAAHLREVPPAPVQPSASAEQNTVEHELVFIDSRVANAWQFADDLMQQRGSGREFSVVLLQAGEDGIAQISRALESEHGLAAIHIVSHGSAGAVEIGGTQLDAAQLERSANDVARWGEALGAGGDLLLYGCDTAQGAAGQQFITLLAQLTGADVAASSNTTGHAARGGDWLLEARTGAIDTAVAPSAKVQQAWDSTLDITTNLVARWAFDSNANDSSGNANNGTLTNGAAINTTGGTNKIGAGKLALDGSNDYVSLDSSVSSFSGLTQGTISAWVRNSTGNSVIFSSSDTADNESEVTLRIRSTGQIRFMVSQNDTNLLVVDTTATVNNGAWRHIAVTVDASGNKLYIDGVLAAVTYITGNASTNRFFDDVTNQNSASIGRNLYNGGVFDPYNGFIDDTRIYSRALTAGDVAELYNFNGAGVTVTPSAGLLTTESGGTASFNVVLVSAPTADVTIPVSSSDTSEGSVSTASLVFTSANWATPQTVTVTGVDDGLADGLVGYSAVLGAATSADGSYNGINPSDVQAATSDNDIGYNAITVNTTSDAADGDTSSLSALAANRGADGFVSLREAITAANNTTNGGGGADRIWFNVGAGIQTLTVGATALPSITDSVLIDGWTSSGYTSTPVLQLNGNNAGSNLSGFTLAAGSSGSTIRGFIINRFTASGIVVANSNNQTIQGNWIGLNSTGTAASANGDNGIYVTVSTGNLIGGSTAATRNTIAGNTNRGIYFVDGDSSTISGNYVGTDITGLLDLNGSVQNLNQSGIVLSTGSSGNTVGGLLAGQGNLASGNNHYGIEIQSSSQNNLVQGNYVGTTLTGLAARANVSGGMSLWGSGTGNVIGGSASGARNILSGNAGEGILVGNANAGGTVQGNYIGLGMDGSTALGNGTNGIYVYGASTGLLIGTNADGSFDANERNVISGNLYNGIEISGTGTTGVVVQGNYIGVDATGALDRGNTGNGVAIYSGATGNFIGGTATGAGNVLSGNDDSGVDIAYAGTSNNQVLGNNIGLNAAQTATLGNLSEGIWIGLTATNNMVGGTSATAGNIITGAGSSGVVIDDNGTTDNAVLGNRIYGNAGLGIDLSGNGVSLNDFSDGDGDSNRLQNTPLLSVASTNASTSITVEGTLNTNANVAYFRIGLFASPTLDANGHGEGQVFLGSVNVTTDSTGRASFNTTLAANVAAGQFITATATKSNAAFTTFGDTSEFSLGIAAGLSTSAASYSALLQGGGVAFDVKGMRTSGSFSGGSLTPSLVISGVPAGATIVKAWLYVTELDKGTVDTGFTLAGNAVTASAVSSARDTGWSSNGVVTVKADVSAFVTGNGTYVLGGTNTLGIDDYEGAVLVVVYSDTSTNTRNIVTINDRTTSITDSNGSIALGFNAGASIGMPPSAGTLYLATLDGQSTFNDSAVLLQASTAGSATQVLPANSFGNTNGGATKSTIDITALIKSGDTGATLTQASNNTLDYVVHTFSATVVSVRVPPSNTVPGAQSTNEDTFKVFSSGTGNQISISDNDAGSASNEVTLSVTNGTLSLFGTTGLTFSVGDGTTDTTMTLRGTVAAINTALNGMRYTPTADYFGAATLTLTTKDSLLLSLDIDATLRGRYTFENTGALGTDTSPAAANPGTPSGVTANLDGTRGNVLSLGGAGSIQTTGMYANPANVTLAAWVNLTTADTSGSNVISLGDNIILRLDGGANDTSVGVSGIVRQGGIWVQTSSTAYVAGTGWHHVAFTFDDAGNSQRLYLDGQLIAQTSNTASIVYERGTNTFIGKHGDGLTSYDFTGKIDDARIYSRVLTAAEVAALAADLALIDTDSVALTVTAVNGAPTASNLNAAEAYTEDTNTNLINIVASDVDSANITATLTLSDINAGSLLLGTSNAVVSSYNAGTGVWTASGAPADVNVLLAGVTYLPASNYNGNFTIATSISDGVAPATTGSKAFTGTAVNDAPMLITVGSALPYTENGAAAAVDNSLTVSDVDSATLTSATVTIASNYANGQDVLAFTTQNGISGSWNAGTGVMTLTGSATVLNYQAALRSVTYVNTSDNPSTATRTVNFAVSDASATSNTDFRNITVTAINDAPTIFQVGGATAAYNFENGSGNAPSTVSGGPALAVGGGVTYNVSAGRFSGSTGLLFSSAVNSATPQVSLSTLPGVAASNAVSFAAWVRFDQTDSFARIFDFAAGASNSALLVARDASSSNLIVGTQVASVWTGSVFASNAITNGTWLHVGVTVNSANLVTLYVNGASAGSYTASSAINYAGLTRNYIGASNYSGDPQFRGAMDDIAIYGTALSAGQIASLASTSAPYSLAGTNENTTSSGTLASAVLTGSSWADEDAGALSGLAVTATAGNGAWQYSTDGATWANFGAVSASTALLITSTTQVRYVPDNINGETATFSYRAWDQTSGTASTNGAAAYGNPSTNGVTTAYSSRAGTVQMVVSSVNDAPVLATGSTLAYTENQAATAINTAITVADVDSTTLASATVQITANYASGEDVLAFSNASMGNIAGAWNAGTGTMTLTSVGATATLAHWQAALRAVTYANSSENPNTAARTVSYAVNDGALASNTVTSTVNVSTVNDAPTATNLSAAETYSEDTALNLIDIVISDVDSANVTATLTLSNSAAGSLNTGSAGAVTSTYNAGTGVWVASGAMADVNTLLAALSFTPSAHFNTNFTIAAAIGDGTAALVTGSKAMTGTPVNDAPTGGPVATGTAEEDNTLTADVSGIADADGLSAFTFQWLRGGVAVAGATSSSYTLGDADVGVQMAVRVSYTDTQGTAETLTSALTAAVANVNDAPTGSVTIDDSTPTQGQTLTASNSLADADGLGAVAYRWQRDGVDIAGATSGSYTTTQADVGRALRAVAEYTDALGTAESVASANTTAVANVNDAPTGAVVIDDTTPTQGQTLTASNTLADADGLGAVAYRWQRDGVDIAGATAGSYTTTQADVGYALRVIASYTDALGTAESVASANTSVVANANDAPTGGVSIDDTTPTQGQTLTASNTLADADGLGTISYRWQRDGVDIAGATAASYTTTQADVDYALRVVAEYTDALGTAESVASSDTSVVANANDAPTGSVTIDDTTPTQGQTLTASNTLADTDGLGAISYRWQRDGVDIAGATAANYTTTQAEVGYALRVIASYTDALGTAESVASANTSVVANVNDAPTGAVAIDDTTPTQGQTLTASNNLADTDGLGAISYRWQRDGVDIAGATAASYTTTQADVDYALRVVAEYTDALGTAESVASSDTSVVANVNDAPTGAVTIDDTSPTQGQTLTASNTLADTDGLGTISYRWQRDGVDIAGATAASYTTTQADVGYALRVIASYTDALGTAESVASSDTSVVANANDAPTGSVTIDDTTPIQGQTLTASNTLADTDGLGTISYRWQRDGVDIAGATAASYTTTQADVGYALRVIASYTDALGTAESVASSDTSVVANANDAPTGSVTIDDTTPTQGQTLTASNTLADTDGLGTISYRWQRDGVDIAGATAGSYTTTQADVGRALRVVAEYTDALGTAESVVSADTTAVTNVNDVPTGGVSIDDTTPTQGQTLTASNTLADADGLGAISYRWQRDGVDIAGATAGSYTTTQADVGYALRVVADYTDAFGTAESVVSADTTAVANVNDAPTGSVTIDDTTPTQGQTLTASNNLADTDGLGTISYRWQRDGVDIAGATAGSYTTTQADVGYALRVIASYTDALGTAESVASANTTAVANVNDAPSGAVVIDDTTPTQGQTLTASNTLADADGLGAVAYRWQRDGVDIAGATAASYTTTQADVGYALRVIASYTDALGTAESVASANTSVVANVNDAPTGGVTIDDTTPAQGQTLTASNTLADADGLGAVAYRWQRDGVDIAGATATSYTTTQADVGYALRVIASYTDALGTAESVASANTSVVANVNDAPTGSVTIDDTTPTQGQALTASNTLADADGLGAISYRWQRDGVDIAGATAASYTTTQADVGYALRVIASYTDALGTAESVASANTSVVANVNDAPTGSVTIDDTTPTQGQALTASNTLADADGLGAISYRWQRDGVDIAGATAASYTTTQADVGYALRVIASYTDALGTAESVVSADTTAVTNVNDAPTGAVTIDDTTPTQGQTLTASNSLADADGLGTISYRWQRDGVDIAGATAVSYTTTQADVGRALRAVAEYTDALGTAESVASANTSVVANVNDAPTGAVTIDDTTPTQGQTLTASNNLADTDGLGAISYRWQRDGVDIAGATAGSYTTTQADVGYALRVIASYTDALGTAESVASANTSVVANVNDAPTGAVAIDNTTPTQGQTLTASNSLADADGLGAIGYRWQRDGVDIAGATAGSYTTTQADVGRALRVVAEYTDALGNAESVASANTSVVANVNDAPTGAVTIDDTTPTQGQTLTASNNLADTDGLGTISYRWQRDGVDIAGATAVSYTTTQADVGYALRVIASYTDALRTAESVASANTSVVANVNDAPTGAVAIDNTTPTQGQTLTASNSLADADGLGAIGYRWQRDGVDIAGATATSYTTTQADVGYALRVIASYTDALGTAESVASANTSVVANVNDAPTGSVTIDDTTPTQGQTLTASNNLADTDGLGTISYRWQRDGVDIAGATAVSYTTTQADVGRALRVVAEYTDALGNAESVASADTTAVANVNDAPTGAVAIDDTTPTQGQTLTASNILADTDGLGTISYRWQRDGVDIAGATAGSYTTTQVDVGRALRVIASYTDALGTAESVVSADTTAVTNVNDAPTGSVTIDDTTPTQGQTLTASNTLADADGLGAISYRWQRDGVDIAGATAGSYTTTQADVGYALRVIASYTDALGTAESMASASTSVVANANDAPTGSVTIDDTTPTQGQTLTASNNLADTDGLGTISYRWQRDGVDIAGATAGSYTTTQADVGRALRVIASYTDALGTAESVASANTSVVANVNDAPTGGVTIDDTTPAQGQTLTASNTLADADGLGAVAYRWQRDGVDIAGATSGSYTTTQADVGRALRAVAEYTDALGTAESVVSADTTAVANVNDAPTGAVAIDNTTPTQGQTLTASNNLADTDGLGAISYRWQRDGVDIAGATAGSYTTTQADVGYALRVIASYTDALGTAESVASANTSVVANANDAPTGSVTIDDTTPTQGQTLTASNTLADTDGLGAISYRWQRDGVDIAGATAANYTTTQAEVGYALRVIASYTDALGTAESVASANTSVVANVNDAPTGAVAIDDTTPTQGQTLTASNNLADTDGLGAISYRWQRDGVDIAGATAASYTTTQADVDYALRVVAEYTDALGTAESVASSDTSVVANVNDAPTGAVTIDDTTPTQGQTLTASNTLADTDGLGTISYRWQRDGVDIAGATAGSYTTTQADVGRALRVVAEYTDALGTAESVASSDTSVVANANDAPTGSVTIDDTSPTQGQTLTASNTLADTDGLGTISYRWQRDGVDIAGATAASYTTTQADVGRALRVIASYTDALGTSESVVSADTVAVMNMNDAPTGLPLIAGTVAEDQTLAADVSGIADADGLGAMSYQWLRNGAPVAGATGTTYTLGDADVGLQIALRVGYSDGAGALEALASVATSTVLNVNDAPALMLQTFTLQGGGSVVLDAAAMRATDVDTVAAGLFFVVSNVQNARFESAVAPDGALVAFTPADLAAGRVRLVSTSLTQAPAFSVASFDGALRSAAVAATVAFAPGVPLPDESPTVPAPAPAPTPAPTPAAAPQLPEPPVAPTPAPVATPGPRPSPAPALPAAHSDHGTSPHDAAAPDSLDAQPGVFGAAVARNGALAAPLFAAAPPAPATPPVPAPTPATSPHTAPVVARGEQYLRTAEQSAVLAPETLTVTPLQLQAQAQSSPGRAGAPASPQRAEPGAPPPAPAEESIGTAAVETAQLTGLALTAGTVFWALRAGGLVAGLLVSLPAWRHADLLAVLPDEEDGDQWDLTEDDEAARDEQAVGRLFGPALEGDTK